MKKPFIRRATGDDHPQLRELCRAIDPKDYVPYAWSGWMTDENALNLVAEVRGTVVGCIHGEVIAFPDAWSQAARVHPDMQREGIGLKLMAALENELRPRGVTALYGNIGAFNEVSLAFFTKQNWKIVCSIKRRAAGQRGRDGTHKNTAIFTPSEIAELVLRMPVPASCEKHAYFLRAYFSMNARYLERVVRRGAVRIAPGGDGYALLDPDARETGNRLWVVALAGSREGVQGLLEEFRGEAASSGAELIVDSPDAPEIQAMMDSLQFRPPEKSGMYFVVKKELAAT